MPKPRPEASGLAAIVAKAEKHYNVSPLLMPTEAAKAIGISKMTLTRWRRDNRLRPYANIVRKQQAPIPVFGPSEIEAGRALRGKIKPGPNGPLSPVMQATNPTRKIKVINADSPTYRPQSRNGRQKPV
jgi:hypothetical protein